MLANPYQKYKQNQVETSSPQQLIIMLYNGAIKFLKLAQMGITEQSIEKAHTNIIKTQDIINELMASLDMNQGEVASHLYSLYDYMNSRLLEANLKKDTQILSEVENMLTELRDSWVQALKFVQ
ncbi:flagellar export chaperone FliS [Dethiobacter alkaliphilus]|uniref:Flagellar protein FliS n=1 Tax=Dethiobacter alkaliphilus AHT 1 TaxID=555088 RepID=C0GJI9_DETAL|nr:flagellar export chaperone FliS [Dethiobacter alkaliphilus]EEG76536.1 flagellar protein FliS [Dethiobacter alkaliphilus AHT 1]